MSTLLKDGKTLYLFLRSNTSLTSIFTNSEIFKSEKPIDLILVINSLFLFNPFFFKKLSTSIIPLICSKNQKSHPVLL